MKVIIVGLGDVGTQTAEDLSRRKGFELVLIDSNEERCDRLTGEVDALVINGDGTDPEILEKAGIKEADALVATTNSDALNMVLAILAQRYSVSEVIVKLNKVSLRTACNEIGVDQIISPKLSAAVEITSLLHGYDVLDFSLLVRGGSRLTEINPGELVGKKVDEINLPEGILIVSILRVMIKFSILYIQIMGEISINNSTDFFLILFS